MNTDVSRGGERGNVLFLVLIAVILFAALSYAVTSSTRQPNAKNDSVDIIGGAELTQYPTSLRMAIMTMMVSGIDVDELEFNAPSSFGSGLNEEANVFHPAGGGAAYQNGAASVMASGTQGTWYINAEFEIDNVGVDISSNADGNDIIAFLPGIKEGICSKINDRAGLQDAIPNTSADLSGNYQLNMDSSYAFPTEEVILGAAGGNGTDSLTGQPLACFQNNGGQYVYYQVLVER